MYRNYVVANEGGGGVLDSPAVITLHNSLLSRPTHHSGRPLVHRSASIVGKSTVFIYYLVFKTIILYFHFDRLKYSDSFKMQS